MRTSPLPFIRPVYAPEGAAPGAGGAAPPPAGGAPPPAAGQPGQAGGNGAAPPPAAGGAAEPFYKSWNVDGDTAKFLQEKNFADPAALVKSTIEADKKARARAPREMKDPREWPLWEETGWTPDVAKYTVEKPALKDGDIFNQQMFDATIKSGHKHRLAPWQVQSVYADVMADMNALARESVKNGQAEVAKLDQQLRGEWGANYEPNKRLATRAMQYFQLGATDSKMLDQALGAPGMVKMFHAIGELMGEDRMASPGGSADAFDTAEKIQAEIKRLHADEKFLAAINDARHPQHEDQKAYHMQLIERLAAKRRNAR